MATQDDILANMMITNRINLLRFTAGEQRRVIGLLNTMQNNLTARLQTGLTDFGKARVNRLLKESEEVIGSYYMKAADSVDIADLAQYQAEHTVETLATVGVAASLPAQAVMRKLVGDVMIFGAPSAKWWAKQADETAFKFAAQVRQGIVQGETIQQIVRRIAGGSGEPGIMAVSRKNAAALVHTSVMTVSNNARMETYKENDDVIEGVRQLSTLDGHTTPICIAYSGAQWDLDGNPINGTTLPFYNVGGSSEGGTPRHWGCRSLLVPITVSYRSLGVPIDEMAPGTRASSLGPVRADMTMDEYLKEQPPEVVDEMLGKGRADLYRRGKITLQDLVSGNGRELTLEQLKKRGN